jgi:fructose-1,6-bisphosphatase I
VAVHHAARVASGAPVSAGPQEVGREVVVAEAVTLETWLDRTTTAAGEEAAAAAQIVLALTEAGRAVAALLAAGPLASALALVRKQNGAGDAQKKLDLGAHELVLCALREAPAAAVLSEEAEEPEALTPGAPLVVAVDPLDGSSKIDTNVPVGTIFSILPATSAALPAVFLQAGWRQVAAGFLIYGPQIALVLSFGDGTAIFTREPATGRFICTAEPRPTSTSSACRRWTRRTRSSRAGSRPPTNRCW